MYLFGKKDLLLRGFRKYLLPRYRGELPDLALAGLRAYLKSASAHEGVTQLERDAVPSCRVQLRG